MKFIALTFAQLKRMLTLRNTSLDIASLGVDRSNMVDMSREELDLFYDDLVEAKEDNDDCDNDLIEHFEE